MTTKARARKTDPATSHEAATSVSGEAMSETKKAIVNLLSIQSMTDDELFMRYFQGAELGHWQHASQSGVRSRRSELVKSGVIRAKGFSKTKFNRPTTIWGI